MFAVIIYILVLKKKKDALMKMKVLNKKAKKKPKMKVKRYSRKRNRKKPKMKMKMEPGAKKSMRINGRHALFGRQDELILPWIRITKKSDNEDIIYYKYPVQNPKPHPLLPPTFLKMVRTPIESYT